MTSFKSRLFNFMIRNGYLFRGKIRKETFNQNTSIIAFRERCEKGAARFSALPPGLIRKEDNMAGLRAEWLIPAGSPGQKLIFYIHGGGYVSGSCSDHRGLVAKFAEKAGLTCLLFEYRLAPEHPFPAALEDSLAVYAEVLQKGYASSDILFAGESAGGGLLLATLLAIRDRNLPMPAAGVTISPWTDLACTGDSYRTKNKVSPAPLNSWYVFSKHYAGSEPTDNPLISPLYGDPAGLPPLFINAGMNDELFDDGERFYQKAKAAGVDVTFRPGPGQIHCYPLLAPMFPEATAAMEEIVQFIKVHLRL
jgi:acetyl esterase/lipase